MYQGRVRVYPRGCEDITTLILLTSIAFSVVSEASLSEDSTVKIRRLRFYFFKNDLDIVLTFGAVLKRLDFFGTL